MSSTSTIQRSEIPTIEPTPRQREPNINHASLMDMNGADISGSLFINASSPVNVHIGAEFVPSVRQLDVGTTGSSGNVHPTNASDNGSNITITPEPSQTAPYDIYYRHLLGEGRGVPLWKPGPDMSLPVDYRQKGISIGDVGIVYRAGYFDFLFNIFLPADHEINLGRVPNGFVPLDKSKLEKGIRKSVESSGCLASSSVQQTGSSEFAFQTTGRDGAVLVMPDGALAEDLTNYNLVNKYIAENAKRWYDYVGSDERGVQAENGDIRVVVGMDKVSSWGMVAFKGTNTEGPPRRFEFKDDWRGGSHGKIYKWDGIVAGRAGPADEEISDLVRTDDNTSPLRNQCVFVRTLNISVSGQAHDELAVREIRASQLRDCIPDSSRQQTQPGQQNINIQTPQVGLPVSNPSKPLHKYLLEKCPNAQVVITADLDWMSVITKNDAATLSSDEICSRVLASHTICEKKGVVTLKKRKNDVTVTGYISDARAISSITAFRQTTFNKRPLLWRDGYVAGRVFLKAPDETVPPGTLSDISVGKRRSNESSRIGEPTSLLYPRPSCRDPSDDDGGGTNVSSAKQRIIDSEDRPVFDSAAWKPGEDVQDLTTNYPEDHSHQSLSPSYSDARPERSKDLSLNLADFHSKAVKGSYAPVWTGTFCIAEGICKIAAVIVIAALVAWVRYRNPDFSFVPSSIDYLGKGNLIGSIFGAKEFLTPPALTFAAVSLFALSRFLISRTSSFNATEKRNIAFYIAGIMMYKLGLEFFNGSITTLATDRFNATNTFTKLGAASGINQAAQCVGAILIAPLIKRWPTRTVLATAIFMLAVMTTILLIVDGGKIKAANAKTPKYGNWNSNLFFVVWTFSGILYGMVELIQRVIPADIVGGDVGIITRLSRSIVCLTRGQSISPTITMEAGLIPLLFSLLSSLFVLVPVIRIFMHHPTNTSRQFFHQQIDMIMASLLFCDILQAMGDGRVDMQSFLNAQGIIQRIGKTAVNLTNAMIVHMFGVQIRGVSSRRFPFSLVAAIHTCIPILVPVVMAGICNQESSFMSPVSYWCWVGERNMGLRWIRAEYMWLWLSLAISLLLSIPLYLWMHRNPRFSTDTNSEIRTMRFQMIYYPLVFCIFTLSLSAFRAKVFLTPPALTIAAVALFALNHNCHGSDPTRDSGDEATSCSSLMGC